MAAKQNEWRLWALDDAGFMESPPIRGEDDESTETLWAVDAQVWDEEPQTSPDVDDEVDQSESGSNSMP